MEFTQIKSQEDILKVREIWKNAFIDNDIYLDRFFGFCFPHLSTFALKQDGEIRSIASLIEVIGSGLKLKYLYGVATPIEFRGREYSQALTGFLLDKERSEGTDAVLTRPANLNLFGFYRRQGFTIDLKRRIQCQEIRIQEVGETVGTEGFSLQIVQRSRPDLMKILYDRCIEEAREGRNLTYNLPVLQFAIDDFLEDSGHIFLHDQDYFFSEKSDDFLQITSSSTSRLPRELTNAIAASGIRYAHVILPDRFHIGIPETYGLAHLLNERLNVETIKSLPPLQFLME